MASNGYYALWSKPDEMTTDTAATFKLSTVDTMTGVTYSVKYEFTCDGVTTSQTIATGLTATTYTYTPSTATFAPLMTKSEQGTIRMAFETNNGRGMTYYVTIPLKLKASIKPSLSNLVTSKTNYFNSRSISNITTHKYTFKVAGLYGASQTVNVTIGDSKYTKEVAAVSDNTSTSVSFDIGAFEATGSSDYDRKRINIKITDSRGRTYTSSDYIDIYKYSPPDVVASVARNEDEQPVLTFKSSYQATVAGAANSLKQFFARVSTDSTTNNTDLKGKTSPQVLTGTYDISKSYTVYIFIQDQVRPSAILKKVILPSTKLIMDVGADGKTVAFFGVAPPKADEESLIIGDTSQVHSKFSANGFSVFNSVGAICQIGYKVNNGSKELFYTLGERNPDSEIGRYSMAEGTNTTASGSFSHAEGEGATASGEASHAEGYDTTASGKYSHAEGMQTIADGGASHASGSGTKAMSNDQMVIGRYNIADLGSKYLLIVGNGTSDTARSNAFMVAADGKVTAAGNIYMDTGQALYRKDSSGVYRELISLNNTGLTEVGYGSYQQGSRETMLSGGNKLSFKLKSPSATWNPYYAKGDSVSLTIGGAGFITNLGKDVWFMIPLGKPVIGNPTVTITSVDGLTVRQNNKYLYGGTSSTYVKPSSYSCVSPSGNHIRVVAKMANTTNVENNSACGVLASIKVTFS